MNANSLTAMASRLFSRASNTSKSLTTVPFRTATTTARTPANKQGKKTGYEVARELGKATKRLPAPEYPYGPRTTFKRANRGLFGNAELQAGNKVSKGRNKGKTRRVWLPNVTRQKFFSPSLNKNLTIRLQHRVWRTIRKCGGIEEYVMGDSPSRIRELGVYGWNLRWKVMNTPTWKRKFDAQRAALGLPAPPRTFKEWMEEQRSNISGPVLSDEAAGMIEILDDEKKLAEAVKGLKISATAESKASGKTKTPQIATVTEESAEEQQAPEVVLDKAQKAEAEREEFLKKFF